MIRPSLAVSAVLLSALAFGAGCDKGKPSAGGPPATAPVPQSPDPYDAYNLASLDAIGAMTDRSAPRDQVEAAVAKWRDALTAEQREYPSAKKLAAAAESWRAMKDAEAQVETDKAPAGQLAAKDALVKAMRSFLDDAKAAGDLLRNREAGR